MKLGNLLKLILCLSLLAFSIFAFASCHKCEWGEWEIVEEATCLEEGEMVRYCKHDKEHEERKPIEALGHDFSGEWHNDKSVHWQVCLRSECGKYSAFVEHASDTPATKESPELCKDCGFEIAPKLPDQKVIFIGDSFVYFGNTVIEKTQSVQDQELRTGDKGYFHQICKANGLDVEVTNWTYGGHGLSTHLQENCTHRTGCNGTCHIEDLTERYFDIVVLSGGRGSAYKAETFFNEIETFIEIFRSVNPNVKFVYLVSSGAHNVSVEPSFPIEVLNSLDTLEDEYGFTIVDWGKLVKDIIDGVAVVEGATQVYKKTSFTIAKDNKDGYHPSPLAGYITSLMTYCAITGESAVGQDYSFCSDSSIDPKFNFNTYMSNYYKKDTTNFPEIFKSESDMLGIQKLIDKYLADKAYRNYNFQ